MENNEIEITYFWKNDQLDYEIELIINNRVIGAIVSVTHTEAYGDVMDEPGIYYSKLVDVFKIDDLTYFNASMEEITLPKDESDDIRHEIAQKIENATDLIFIEFL